MLGRDSVTGGSASMRQYPEILARRDRSARRTRLLLAGLAAGLAVTAVAIRHSAQALGIDAGTGDGLSVACLCAALAAMLQEIAWRMAFKTERLAERDAGHP